MRYEISIDKVSFTAKPISGVDGLAFNELLSSPYYGAEYKYTPWNFMYQHNFSLSDGSFFQYGEVNRLPTCRLEFNPNKANFGYLQKLISKLKYPKLTRIDWACDYFGLDVTRCQIQDHLGRSEREFRGRNKKLETLYLGNPSTSDKFLRIYNKAKERNKDESVTGHWWRFESVVKDFETVVEKEIESVIEVGGKLLRNVKTEKVKEEGYIFRNPFESISVYEKKERGSEKLKTAEKAMLFFLEYHPEEWDKLSDNTRRKYESLKYVSDWELIEIQPKEVFEKEKNRLADELEAWLKPAMDNGKFLIGDYTNIEYSLMFLRNQEKAELQK